MYTLVDDTNIYLATNPINGQIVNNDKFVSVTKPPKEREAWMLFNRINSFILR